MFYVRELNTLGQLRELALAWDALLKHTPGATFFQSLGWLETYWQHYGSDSSAVAEIGPGGQPIRLRVLAVEENGTVVGILPLAVWLERYRVGILRVLGYPLASWGSFYGPIGPDPAAILAEGLQHIRNSPRDWDLIDLRSIDSQIDQGATAAGFQAAGYRCEQAAWQVSAQIELDSGWDAYWNSRKSRWRSNVRRCQRLLEKIGPVKYVRYRPACTAGVGISDRFDAVSNNTFDPRWDLFDTCVALADRSWQGTSTTGTTMSHPSVRDFLRAVHAEAVRAGAVDLNLLYVAGKPVAYAYNYHFHGSVFGLRSGYDPAAAHEGAGNVLLQKMIEDSCRRGDRLIDLGVDYLDAKRQWLTRLKPVERCTHFSTANLRAQAMRLKQAAKRWLGRSAQIESMKSSDMEKIGVRI